MSKVPFNPVNNVLNKVLSNLGLDRRLREHTFMTLWPTFVTSAIADRSRPLFIDAERNLVVSVSDAATGQELSMMRGKVLSKLGPAARSLNIDIRGIRLDMKNYHSLSTMPPRPEEVKPLPKPTDKELDELALTQVDREQLSQLQHDLAGDPEVDERTRAKVQHLFERELRIRRWRLLHNYPQCPQCGNPVERLHPREMAPKPHDDGPPICIACLYSD